MLLKPKYQIVIAGLCLAIVAILSLMIEIRLCHQVR